MNRIEMLLSYLEEDPDDAFTLFALATEYVKAGDSTAALQYFETLMKDHPDYVGTYYHVGKLYERLDRPGDAASAYRSGIKVSERARDQHSRSELQAALLEVEGIDFD